LYYFWSNGPKHFLQIVKVIFITLAWCHIIVGTIIPTANIITTLFIANLISHFCFKVF
jgi:hypothetical protein